MTEFLDEKGHALRQIVEAFNKNVQRFQTGVGATVKSEGASSKSYTSLSQSLKEMAKSEDHEALQDCFKRLAETLDVMEEHRDTVLVERLTQTVVRKLDEIDEFSVKPTKLMIYDREAALKSMNRHRQQFQVLTNKGTMRESKMETKRAQLEDDVKRAQNINSSVDSNILKYQQRRVDDVKEMLQEYVMSNLFFHCRGVETWAAMLKQIEALDGNVAQEELKQMLKDCDDAIAKVKRYIPK